MWLFSKKKTNFDVPLAYRLINLSRIAYYDKNQVTKELDNMAMDLDLFFNIKETDTQGFIANDDKDIFVVFRGTESLRDALIDVNTLMNRYPESGKSFFLFKPKVHAGFLKAYLSVKQLLLNRVGEMVYSDGKNRVYVTGHSLGGALALLATLDIIEILKIQDVYMMNFGGPKVGNKWYVRRYNKKVKNSFRVVNDEDVVPILPIGGYKHVKHLVFINNQGEVLIDPKSEEMIVENLDNILSLLTGEAIKDHFSRYYASVIKQLLNKSYEL